MRSSRIVVPLALAATVVLVPTPAQASTYTRHHGRDVAWATHGYTAPDGAVQEHRQISVRDNEDDGHRVQVAYQVQGVERVYHLYAPPPPDDGTSQNWNSVPGARAITRFRVCEHRERRTAGWSCSRWLRVDSHIAV